MSAKVGPAELPDIKDQKLENEKEFIRKVEEPEEEEEGIIDDFFDDQDIEIPPTAKELLVHFGSYVTIDGIGKIIESQTKPRRIMWIIVVIVMSIWGTYQCVMVSIEYFSYPKTVTITVKEETKVEFPAITICNLNPLPNKDKLRNHEVWGAFIAVEEMYSEPGNCNNLQEENYPDDNDSGSGSGDKVPENERVGNSESETGSQVEGSDTADTDTSSSNSTDDQGYSETGSLTEGRPEVESTVIANNTADDQGYSGTGSDTEGSVTSEANPVVSNTADNQEYPETSTVTEGSTTAETNPAESNSVDNQEYPETRLETEGNGTAENSPDESDPMPSDSQNFTRSKRETSEDPMAGYLDALDGKRDGLLNISYYQKLIHYIVSLASQASEQKNEAPLKTPTDKTYSLKDIVKIREECSSYYKYLSYVKIESSIQEQPTVTFAATKDKRCKLMSEFRENVTFNILCNMEVFCDNFGCYDYNLKVYGEKRKVNGSVVMVCPSCANEDETWPDTSYSENAKYCGANSTESKKCPSSKKWKNCLQESSWLNDWNDGNLTDWQVIGAFETSKTKDFSDVLGMYSPSNDDVKKYSVRKEDFILSCSYDRRSCSNKGFYAWPSDTFGMCYTFNSVFNKLEVNNKTVPGKIRKTSSYGPRNGLRLTLDIKADQYISLLSPDIGARVLVHSPRQMPFISEEGFNVSPGLSISVGIKRKELIRVGPPHGQCRSDSGSKLLKEYSATRCRKMCLEKEYWRLCGCYEGLNPAYNGTSDELRPPHHCSVFNVTQKMCMEKVRFLYQQGGLNCDCSPACKEMKFINQVTPSEENKAFYTIVQNIKKIDTDVCSNNSGLSTVRLHFYLDSLNHETVEESPTYTFDMFIANIGNNFGLFIGMSLMTFIELVEFMFDLSLFCGISAYKARQSNNMIKVASARNQRFDSEASLPSVYTTHPLKVDSLQALSY